MSGDEGVKEDEGAWLDLVHGYQVQVRGDQRVIRARLKSDHLPPDERLDAVRAAWSGPSYVMEDEAGAELLLMRSSSRLTPRWWLHLLLFVLTLFTTHMAGALMAGFDPLATHLLELGPIWIPYPTGISWSELGRGWTFAIPFTGILLLHEMGHYLTARRHRVPVTPPFFIPFPAYWSIVGSLGAFIRIRGPLVRRSVLLDVGAAGPLASFVVSIPVVVVGLALSEPATGAATLATPYVVPFAGQAIWVGNGALFHALAWLSLPEALGSQPIVLHPVAFAGWLGLFLTALNLLPMGQLDGGHVLYALAGRRQHRAGRLFLLSLLPLGFLWWGWWVWAVAAFLVNRGRVRHPPVLQDAVPLGGVRRAVAWGCIVIFLLTFVPLPLRL